MGVEERRNSWRPFCGSEGRRWNLHGHRIGGYNRETGSGVRTEAESGKERVLGSGTMLCGKGRRCCPQEMRRENEEGVVRKASRKVWADRVWEGIRREV